MSTVTDYYDCLYDIDIAANELRTALNISQYIRPASSSLEIYMIDKVDDTSTYKTSYQTEIIRQKQKFYAAQARLDKASIYPSVKLGLFFQQYEPFQVMKGLSVGVTLPVFYGSDKAEAKQNELLSLQTENEYNQALLRTQIKIETLIIKLDKTFMRIRYFQDYALPSSEMAMKLAVSNYQSEEISFGEFFRQLDAALKIQLDYLECINEYNQTALELELYTD